MYVSHLSGDVPWLSTSHEYDTQYTRKFLEQRFLEAHNRRDNPNPPFMKCGIPLPLTESRQMIPAFVCCLFHSGFLIDLLLNPEVEGKVRLRNLG
jgi:hypothetical protein